MPASVHELHLIGNAHIDPVWIWDWREGYGEVWATFRSAIDLLHEHPELRFTTSSAACHEWIERNDPELFAEIAAAVGTGRWVVVGGMWVEPDCNLPSGESLSRQLLLGQRYFQRAFGRQAHVGYNIDSFGHASGLPQLLKLAGLSAYVMMRPDENERALPAPLFRWRDPSGAEVATYRIPFAYEARTAEIPELVRRGSELAAETGGDLMLFFGVGNHGGGPTRATLAALDEARARDARLRYSDPESFFAARADSEALPVVASELQHHAVGCYSASRWIKAANAAAESALLLAEQVSRMGAVCLGQTDETDALREAWEELLFCQFHDTLAGTASVHGYGSIRSKLGFVEAVADRVATKGLQGLARSIDTSLERPVERESSFWDGSEGVGIPFLVYNPLPWRVRGPVVASRSADDVVDSAGRELEHQAVASGEVTLFRSHTLWLADLEPLGYEVYWLREGRLRAASEVAQVPRIERGRFRVELDTDTGTLSHIVDRETGMNLVARQGIQLVAVDDPTDTWSHGTVRYGDEGPALTLTGWEVVEDGPVRSTLRLRFRGAGSVIRLDVAVYEDLDFVEIVVDADWQAVQTALKLSCAWSLDDAAATVAGAPYSFAERAASTGEEPMQSWLDVADERRGVLVTTSHPHGYDATGPNVRLTLLRNPLAADHGFGWAERPGEDFPATDSGRHTITLRFHPHHGDWRTVRANHQALLHQQPPTVLATSYHAGGRAQRGTFLSIEPEGSALVTAVKRFEDGGGTVFRLWEPYGSAVSGCLRGELVGRDAGFTLAPYEVQTLLVPDDLALPSRALMLTEFELPIDGDDSTG